jgi:hypothetical protein
MKNMYKYDHLSNLLTVSLVFLLDNVLFLLFLEASPKKQGIDDRCDNNGNEDDDDFRMDLALRKTSFNAVGNHSAKPSLSDRSTSMVSEGGWSDDDSNTVKSDYTDKSWGTIGSAIVVDATITSKEDATKHLSKMAAAQINQTDENAKQQDFVFTPPSNETKTGDNEGEDEEDDDAKISSSFKKKKNKIKNKSKGSEDNNTGDDVKDAAVDVDDTTTTPSKKNSKKKKKKKKKN